MVCSVESMRVAWCSVPAKREAQRVRRGSMAEPMKRFIARAVSVVQRPSCREKSSQLILRRESQLICVCVQVSQIRKLQEGKAMLLVICSHGASKLSVQSGLCDA